MLHLLYILAFTILAFLAIGNLIRNLVTLGIDANRGYSPYRGIGSAASGTDLSPLAPHPEFLDNMGNLIDEPLLIMRSITVEDAREKLDSLYNASPSAPNAEGYDESP